MMQFVPLIIVTIIIIIPTWKILGKAGFTPVLSLLVIIPWIGFFIILIVLAFAKWPNADEREA